MQSFIMPCQLSRHQRAGLGAYRWTGEDLIVFFGKTFCCGLLAITPPEIIVLWGIVAFAFPIHEDLWRQSHLIPAASEQAITGHHPAKEEAVFLETLDTVLRAGGMHRAVLTIDGRNVCPVELNQKPQGVEGRIHLLLGVLAMAILIPRTLEGSGIAKGREKEKKGNQASYQKNVKIQMPNEIQMPKCQNFCSIRWMLGLV